MEKVKEALNEEKSKGAFSITIITGNSSVLQKRIFNEILQDSSFTYYIPSWNLLMKKMMTCLCLLIKFRKKITE